MRNIAHRHAGLLLAAFSAVSFALPARAEGGPVATACAGDKAKFCAEVPHGGGQVRACLTAHQDKVSEGCKAAMAAHQPGGGGGKKPEGEPTK